MPFCSLEAAAWHIWIIVELLHFSYLWRFLCLQHCGIVGLQFVTVGTEAWQHLSAVEFSYGMLCALQYNGMAARS